MKCCNTQSCRQSVGSHLAHVSYLLQTHQPPIDSVVITLFTARLILIPGRCGWLLGNSSESMVLVQLVTYTSDLRGAGTDATVFVELTGKLDSSPRHSLIAPGSASDSFGRGQTDTFTLQLPELGVLQSLTIGRDSLAQQG